MQRLLICGDSFAADWTKKYQGQGWPNLLDQHYSVTNLAQAGCSEYRIWLQIESQLSKLGSYDYIIVSHTSPYRIYVNTHPVHANDILHSHSDLIYQDIKEHSKTQPELDVIVAWFEKYYDMDHAKFAHNLICEHIDRVTEKYKRRMVHVSHMDWTDLYAFDNMINFNHLFETNQGLINHYDEQGNRLIFDTIQRSLQGLDSQDSKMLT